jgi:hypothetical protein
MAASSTLPPIASQLREEEWDTLTNLVLDERVVPVTGPELLTVCKDGREEPLYDLWGRVLGERAERAGLAIPAGSLYQVANELSQRKGQNLNVLAADIYDVIRRTPLPIPEALQRLAEISSFPLYITTTIDHLLKEALEEAHTLRPWPIKEIKFMPAGNKEEIDLPEKFAKSGEIGLFYLFGDARSAVDGTFAKTEDDLIEFSWSLLDQTYAPKHLYEYLLQKAALLLLGCDFPDWLARFFIRALEQVPHGEKNIYYVSAHCEAGLKRYLERRHARVLTEQSPVAFVEELHGRWKRCYKPSENQAVADLAPPFKHGSVFLSYASEDRLIVREIRKQLEEANIDTWMEERDLGPGEQFEWAIREKIDQASFFVAIISRSLDGPGRYVLREWKWAENASESRHKEDCFLQPVVIDDTQPKASFVDPPYRGLNWTRLRDGRLPQEFLHLLFRGIRKYRDNQRSR